MWSCLFIRKEYQKLYWNIHTHIRNAENDEGKELLDHAGYVNAKASSLFTHVSIMMVVAMWALEHPGAKQHILLPVSYIDFVLGGDVILYIVIAFLCLRGIWVTHCATFKGIDYSNMDKAICIFRNIVTARKNTFYASLLMTWFATALFMLSFIAKFLVNT